MLPASKACEEGFILKTFLTSDLHFFHGNIIGFCNRPFGSVGHMNAKLVENWNSVVGEDDHIYMLGDFSFGKMDETIDILEQLKGIKYKITGNHDRKGRCEKLPWEKYFVDQHDYKRIKVNLGSTAVRMALCHFPFASWERGYYNFHGHLHNPAGYQNKWRQWDVGVDANNYTPLLLEDAMKRADAGVKSENGMY